MSPDEQPRSRRIRPHQRPPRAANRLAHDAAIRSAVVVTPVKRRSISRHIRVRSASRVTSTASPNTAVHLANGSGIRNSSHDGRRRAGWAPTATGTMRAPVRAARAMAPGLKTSRGPRGRSGTSATSSPRAGGRQRAHGRFRAPRGGAADDLEPEPGHEARHQPAVGGKTYQHPGRPRAVVGS